MLSLFKIVGIATCLKSTAHFCVIWRGPQVSCRKLPFWQERFPNSFPSLVQTECQNPLLWPACYTVYYILFLFCHESFFDPQLEFHFEKITLWDRQLPMFLSLISPCICWDRFPNPFCCEIARQLVCWTVGLPCCYCSTHLQSYMFSCRFSTQIICKQQPFFSCCNMLSNPFPSLCRLVAKLCSVE